MIWVDRYWLLVVLTRFPFRMHRTGNQDLIAPTPEYNLRVTMKFHVHDDDYVIQDSQSLPLWCSIVTNDTDMSLDSNRYA